MNVCVESERFEGGRRNWVRNLNFVSVAGMVCRLLNR